MEVVAADDDGAGHLGGDDTAGEDAATDRDLTSEGALLVYNSCLSHVLLSQETSINAPM